MDNSPLADTLPLPLLPGYQMLLCSLVQLGWSSGSVAGDRGGAFASTVSSGVYFRYRFGAVLA